jgi:beta-aspartyl-peptidase (threonine type)
MKRLFAIVLWVLAAASVSAAGNPDANAEIGAVLNAQVAAWNRGDIDGFMDGYVRSDKVEFVSGGKITRGWQTVRDRYHRTYASREKMGRLTFSDIKYVSLNARIVMVIGRWSLQRKSDRPHGSFELIFRPTSAGWRIAHDHTETM